MVNTNSGSGTGNTTSATTLERRLKPIYDCLDNGSNKKAVQEADRLLKKVKDLQCVKALKSLALLRLSKDEAANEILADISPNEPLDEITLQTMTICYRESSQVDKIVHLYEAACERDPANEELLAHLFMANVRTCNYKKQKEIAINMYKIHPRRPYYFWAILSLVMQARDCKRHEDKATQRVCLSLAEKMCKKMLDEEKTHEEWELELYTMILHKLNMFDEEYRVLTDPMCLRMSDHLSKLTRARAYLCLDLKWYFRAFKKYFPILIKEYPDQLEYYQGLFKSALLLETESAPSHQQQPQQANQEQQTAASVPPKTGSSLAECFDIVERQCLMAMEAGGGVDQGHKATKTTPASAKNQQVLSRSSSRQNRNMIRGPFMARIELYHMIQSNEASMPANVISQCKNQYIAKYPSLNVLLVDYFQSFSRKLSCFFDMEYMISKCELDLDTIKALLTDIESCLEAECGKPSPHGDNQEHFFASFSIMLNYHILEHCYRQYQPSDDVTYRISIAKRYLELYDKNLYLGKDFLKTDFLPVDHYCILAANALLTNSISLKKPTAIMSDSVILTIMVILENARFNSPCNHLIKLTLLKLCALVGASKISASILELLDIKHFQIDTLGHLLNPILYLCGHYSSSQESLQTCSKFYTLGLRECLDSLTTSYRNCRFATIERITDVKDRLANSLNNKQCFILSVLVDILDIGTPAEALVLTNLWQSNNDMKQLNHLHQHKRWNDIRDNRDFKVLRSFHSKTNKLIEDRLKRSYDDELIWLQARYHMIRCVSISYSSCLSPSNGHADEHKNINEENLLDSFKCLVELKAKMATLYSEKDDESEILSYLEPEATPFRWKCVDMDHHLGLIVSLIEYYISGYKYLAGDSDADTIANIKKSIYTYLERITTDLEKTTGKATCLANMKQVFSALTIAIETISVGIMLAFSLTPKMQQQIEKNIGNNAANPRGNKGAPSSNKSTAQSTTKQSIDTSKSGTAQLTVNDLINRFECHVTKILALLKSLDFKAILSKESATLLPELLSQELPKDTDLRGLRPILSEEKSGSILDSVKSKLSDSYSESIKEFERILKKKVRLLRS